MAWSAALIVAGCLVMTGPDGPARVSEWHARRSLERCVGETFKSCVVPAGMVVLTEPRGNLWHFLASPRPE